MNQWVLWSAVAASLLTAGCAGNARQGEEARAQAMEDQRISNVTEKEYHIGVDDVVSVNVWRDPELSVQMPVRPDGRITMPLVGDVQAGGRTPAQVAREIEKRLAAYVKAPNVTVMVSELRSSQYLSRVRVTGAVQRPVSINYQPGMTALDAVLEAGGINEFASPDGTTLYRREGSNQQVMGIELGDILTRGDLSSNVPLKPGDVITVPERLF